MKKKIKDILKIFFGAIVLSFVCGLPVLGQNLPDDLYVISAKAGGVSFVVGEARVALGDGSGKLLMLTRGDELSEKDRVKTGANGKVEVLLNPGSYLRLGEDSEFEFVDTYVESLNLKLHSGRALVDAESVGGDKGASISVTTPQTVIQLQKSGLYRINVIGDTTEVYVWKGAALIGKKVIKEGRSTVIGKDGLISTMAKFDRNFRYDGLIIWSRERAETLAALNNQLRRNSLQNSLAGMTNMDMNQGYWVYDRRTRTWCYVPYYGGSCCRNYNTTHPVKVRWNGVRTTAEVVYIEPKTERDDSSSSTSSDTSTKTERNSDSSTKTERSSDSSTKTERNSDNSGNTKKP
jgi:hypothetical protein